MRITSFCNLMAALSTVAVSPTVLAFAWVCAASCLLGLSVAFGGQDDEDGEE